ncbi:F-box domain-containing protein [Colletotrichum costaricense]|uniref:F-box domain-containing protein n=1 Tax=Colletotrichum costaricense TaxID=1209916 RepID=A0AAI9YGT9_9PEZI|nr:F-box domain-containing protein [Colletotrichum costaricense]KAK1509165.1 F-box domain-containing protein [Colletotrichum costaricense]
MTNQPGQRPLLYSHGHGYHAMQQLPVSQRLPIEILLGIYLLLDPCDFNSSRHTCRSWFLAGMNETILGRMLSRGGWTSSINSILGHQASSNTDKPVPSRASVMSKWLTRECTLGPRHNGSKPAFVEIGQTHFIGGSPISTSDERNIVYTAISHSLPLQAKLQSTHYNVGTADCPPRSVAICPHRSYVAFGSSSAIEIHNNDRSAKQNARRFALSTPSDYIYFLPPGDANDPRRKLRLISAASISDCHAGSLQDVLGGLGFNEIDFTPQVPVIISRLETSELEEDASNVYTIMEQQLSASLGPFANQRSQWTRTGRVLPRPRLSTADNYRAVPLSDGSHILFTDPKTRYLSLVCDDPKWSRAGIVTKVKFCPPAAACESAPLMYAVGRDLVHGVRIAAVFSTTRWTEGEGFQPGEQILAFYTIPPDMFRDLSNTNSLLSLVDSQGEHQWAHWWPTLQHTVQQFLKAKNGGLNSKDNRNPRPKFPIDVYGQVVAVCSGIVDLSMGLGPDMMIWAFGREGLARCWALNTGNTKLVRRHAILGDGSMRKVDGDGDLTMFETAHWAMLVSAMLADSE